MTKNTVSGTCTYSRIVTHTVLYYTRVFATAVHFPPSLILADKARSLPLKRSCTRSSPLVGSSLHQHFKYLMFFKRTSLTQESRINITPSKLPNNLQTIVCVTFVSYPMLRMAHPSRNFFVLSLFCVLCMFVRLRVQGFESSVNKVFQ
jgi:hypothetical protein